MTINLADLNIALQQYKDLKQINTGSDSKTQYQNTKNAINAILTAACLDPSTVATLTAQASSNTANKNANPALPTYNIRTPVVEMSINHFQIVPTDSIMATESSNGQDRVHFQNLSVSFPLGGVDCTVRGNVKLWARDPSSIITALTETQYNKDTNDGLPLLTIRWGWNFATATGVNGIKQAMTPNINFIITNIQMTNPDIGGTEFEFQIQDIGNTVLNYTCPNFALSSDYPQQQIRTLIEGCCGFRLFTLDDLLNLKNIATDGTTLGNTSDSLTFFVNEQVGPFRTHGDNYLVIANRLATQCKCKWYATPNNKVVEAATKSSESYSSLLQAQADLQALKSQTAQTSTQAATLDTQITSLVSKIDDYFSNLSFGCKLYWIDSVPSDWVTTSGTTYISYDNKETGAFFLLPDLSDTTADSLGYMDLNYGPGASSFPYLHGSAQNVFNASIGAANIPSQTFGDVMGINVQYSPLMTMLASSISANATHWTDSDYMATSQNSNVPLTIISNPNLSKAQKDTIAAKGKSVSAQGTSEKDSIHIAIKQLTSRQTTLRMEGFLNGSHTIGDAETTPGASKQYYNTTTNDVYASMKLRSRVNQFLKWPIRATIKVLGDPSLIRLNQGGFELISYFPSSDGKSQMLNTLLSGIYTALQVTHTVSGSDYSTTLSGLKQFDKTNIGSLVTQVITQTNTGTATSATQSANINATTQASNTVSTQALQVDLSDSSFTTGFLATSLQNLYKQQQQQVASTNMAGSGSSNPTTTP
jgi:hypothetical protein